MHLLLLWVNCKVQKWLERALAASGLDHRVPCDCADIPGYVPRQFPQCVVGAALTATSIHHLEPDS